MREFFFYVTVPVYIDDEAELHAYLLNSQGEVVAADAQEHLDYQMDWVPSSAKVDPRYRHVFGNFGAYDGGSSERTIGRKWTDIYVRLFKTDAIPAGTYDLQTVAEDASGNKETYTFARTITVVDAPVILHINPWPEGYAPASVGSDLFYIEVFFTGTGKDDLDVVVKG
ncbi:MAG TPA: hypothetical protein DCZ10_20030 [Pelotomaculum sp.]|nr:hypothetical protein [Pelotomaculum sp.]